jgi:hypothetical protein
VPTTEQRALLTRRTELRDLLADPAVEPAAELTRHGRRNQALTGDAVSGHDLDVYRARRARELEAISDTSDPRHLAAAGVNPDEYARAAPERREALTAQVHDHLARERAQHAAANGGPRIRRETADWVDPDDLRRRTAEHRARMRDERRQRRAGEGVYRPR